MLAERMPSMNTAILPLDAYQTSRRLFPLRSSGEYDMESFECLRPNAIRRDIVSLLAGSPLRLPVFDFITGEFTEGTGEEVKLQTPGVLFIEGLHALHPALAIPGVDVDHIYRLFILPIPRYRFSESAVGMGHRELRLLRRLMRDIRQKRNTPEGNFAAWPSVLEGEATWIFPHLPSAQHVFNNAMDDEVPRMRQQGLDAILSGHAESLPLARGLQTLIFNFPQSAASPSKL
jgi:uridine kinase